MLPEIGHAEDGRPGVGPVEILPGDTGVVLQGPHRRHEDHDARVQVAVGGDDVEKLLGAQIEPEPGLGDHVIGQAERQIGAHDAARALGDVGERPAVDDRRDVFRGLHEVGQQGILQQRRDGPLHLQVRRHHRPIVVGEPHQDPADLLFQLRVGPGKAQDGHDLAGGDDVEPRFPGHAVDGAAEADDDVPEEAVVHVQDAAPGDLPRVDVQGVVMVDRVVHDGGEQIVGALHGVKVVGEVQVDVIHRVDAGEPSPRGASLHAEHGAHGRLPERRDGGLSQSGQGLGEPDGDGGLALARRGGRHGRDENQRRIGAPLKPADGLEPYLGLVPAVGFQVVLGKADGRRYLDDGLQGRRRRSIAVPCHASTR